MINPIPVFVQVIVPLALIWGVGFLGRRLLHLDPRHFSRGGLYLLTPCLVFTSLMESQITPLESGRIILAVVMLAGGLSVLAAALARLLHLSPQDTSAFLLSCIFMNTINYGFPAVVLALGETALERAAVFAVGHAVLANTLGAYIAARGRAGGVRQALREVMRLPMLYAALLALLLRLVGFSFGGAIAVGGAEIAFLPSIYQAIVLLSRAAVPVFALVLGMQLGASGTATAHPAARLGWAIVPAGLIRLIVSPVLAWGITRLVGLEGLSAGVTIMEAAMPSAVTTVVLATEFDAEPRFVTRVIVWTTLTSTVTLTLLLSIW